MFSRAIYITNSMKIEAIELAEMKIGGCHVFFFWSKIVIDISFPHPAQSKRIPDRTVFKNPSSNVYLKERKKRITADNL